MSIPAISNSIITGTGTGKVPPGIQNSMKGREILFPENMMCPLPNGLDNSGRPVCEYSFYTKSAGCNSATDRTMIENDLRPQYGEFLTNAYGIQGPLYGPSYEESITGNFGLVSTRQSINPTSGGESLKSVLQDPAARSSQSRRNLQSAYRGTNNADLQRNQIYSQTRRTPNEYTASANPKINYEIPSNSRNAYATLRQFA